MNRSLVIILVCAGMGACDSRLPSAPDLFVDFDAIIASTNPLNGVSKSLMNGVYQVVQGESELGNPVVGKWVGNRWCLYSQHDVVYTVCAGGSLGDSITLRGYIRVVRSGSGTRVALSITSAGGAKDIVLGGPPSLLRIHGSTEDGTTIDLMRLRDCDTTQFDFLAHRGGGRNSDRLGISENSVEMVQFASTLGATAVEVDVKKTRDGKLIVFHDDTFSPRTVQGAYLLGRVEDFDLEQIKSLGKLINGEQIPTLTELLTAVTDNTQLSLVWLDIKDAAEVSQVVQTQKDMMAYAASKGRGKLNILLGIPSQDVLNAYIPFKDSSDALCELEPANVISLPRCRVWAPVWTRSITPGDVATVHSYNKKVFTWTVDLHETMVDYMTRVDGILTNYPSLLVSIHDSRQ